MKARLIVPGKRPTKLTWTTELSAGRYRLGVILDSEGSILDGMTFRYLRDTQGARIETDNPDNVFHALGVPKGEPGISKV